MPHNTNYLITGSHGFLGKILSSTLRAQGDQVYSLGRSEDCDYVRDITKPFIFPFDIAHPLEVIIHAAGKAHMIPGNEAERGMFFDVNFEGTKNLCSALEILPVLPKAFIFISTVAVYGRDQGDMISESHPLNGQSAYGRSKIMAEEYLQIWAKENNITLSILRLPLVAGPGAPGNLNAMINGIRKGRYLGVGKSQVRKSMVWAEDIAGIIPELAQLGGTFNLTDRCHPSFRELESCISSALDKPHPRRIPHIVAKSLAFIGDFLGKRAPINSSKLSRITSTLTFDDTSAFLKLNWKPSSVVKMLPSVLQSRNESVPVYKIEKSLLSEFKLKKIAPKEIFHISRPHEMVRGVNNREHKEKIGSLSLE